MSFYVERSRVSPAGHGWTGPVRSERQAHREAGAWADAGWAAVVHPSTPQIRARVREWQRAADKRRAGRSR